MTFVAPVQLVEEGNTQVSSLAESEGKTNLRKVQTKLVIDANLLRSFKSISKHLQTEGIRKSWHWLCPHLGMKLS